MEINNKKYNSSQKELITKSIRKGNFDEEQIKLIYSTLNSLNESQINRLVNLDYNKHQLVEILWGIAWNFSIDQLFIYADKKFDCNQMMVVRYCIDDGLTDEQIKYIANPKFDFIKMMDIKEKFKNEL